MSLRSYSPPRPVHVQRWKWWSPERAALALRQLRVSSTGEPGDGKRQRVEYTVNDLLESADRLRAAAPPDSGSRERSRLRTDGMRSACAYRRSSGNPCSQATKSFFARPLTMSRRFSSAARRRRAAGPRRAATRSRARVRNRRRAVGRHDAAPGRVWVQDRDSAQSSSPDREPNTTAAAHRLGGRSRTRPARARRRGVHRRVRAALNALLSTASRSPSPSSRRRRPRRPCCAPRR